MPKAKKINPRLAVPQAPLPLRAVAPARAAGAAAPAKDKDSEDDEEDDDEEDDAKDQAAHDAACTRAADAYRAAADAADAAKGTDSASCLMAGEGAHDSAMEAGGAFQTSCRSMRGADVAADPSPPSDRPGAPMARQIATAAPVATAAAHLEVAVLAKLGRDVLARTGKADAASALAAVEAGALALGEVKKLRVADQKHAAAAHLAITEKRLNRALADGTFSARTQAFDITEETRDGKTVEVLTPKAVWLALSTSALEEQLAALGDGRPARPPAQVPGPAAAREIALGQHGDIKARADADGVPVEIRAQAEAHVRASLKQSATAQPSAQEP